jgi:hypothetical protein
MGLVYAYLVAWVLGGVLLGGRMLLSHRDQESPSPALDAPTPPSALEAHGESRTASSLTSTALIGFGLFGLAAEGLGLANGPWTVACALTGGVVLAMCAYAMRARLVHAV